MTRESSRHRFLPLLVFALVSLLAAGVAWAWPPCGQQEEGTWHQNVQECFGARADCSNGTVCGPPVY
jgi:hypothetical protein